MAKIIYKEGCKGQNVLSSIEGIEIDLINGQKALIFPKYSKEYFMQSGHHHYGREFLQMLQVPRTRRRIS